MPAPSIAHALDRRMSFSASAAVFYVVAILITAVFSADMGFVIHRDTQVLALDEDSNAMRAGLRVGDTILSVNGISGDKQTIVQALRVLPPGETVVLEIQRDQVQRTLRFAVGRATPIAAIAGLILPLLLLILTIMAVTGQTQSATPRLFFYACLVYMTFVAGSYSFRVLVYEMALFIPWLCAMVLVGPITCHFMMRFPGNTRPIGRRTLFALYAPAALLAIALNGSQIAFWMGSQSVCLNDLDKVLAILGVVMMALYFTIGNICRARRLRAGRDDIDPLAVRWLRRSGMFLAGAGIGAALWALHDHNGFIAGGFRPFVAIGAVGAITCVTMAMTRTPFGNLDRVWRRSGGYLLATFAAAALYIALIGLPGGTVSVLSGGNFQAAFAATLGAAVIFGPLRKRLQQLVEERFGRDRKRARQLLRDAVDAAVATLDVDALQTDMVHRVRSALSADGAAFYVKDGHTGAWTRTTTTGTISLASNMAATNTVPDTEALAMLTQQLDQAVATNMPLLLAEGLLAVPLAIEGQSLALVVASYGGRAFDEEEQELLMTAGASLLVALRNAHAHRELKELSESLRREFEQSEKRRREIAGLKDRLEQENRTLISTLASRAGHAPVIGKGLQASFQLAQKVAQRAASVLLWGETGVGKELFARTIHAASPRRDGPFIVVDCGAIASGVFESALFGHEEGAFTGATNAAQGAFRSAHGGTIFLDEIGELPLELQPKLLRVLQEREVHPVGSSVAVPVDVRIVAGTNRDLSAQVEAGQFREDLFYRLRVVEIEIPPLRQRREDIEDLIEHFLAMHAHRAGRVVKKLTAEARKLLVEYDWPGNVRQLEHAIEAAAVYADSDEISASDLPIFDDAFRRKGKSAIHTKAKRVVADGAPKTALRDTLNELERDRLLEALKEHDGNKSRTAKALGMSRGAFLHRLKRYQIVWPPP